MLTLPAKLHQEIMSFLTYRTNVEKITSSYGAPVNLLFPAIFQETIGSFQQLLNSYQLTHSIHYAHKVNQANSLVKTARKAGISIDVASSQELASAFRNGFTSDRIEATGPKGRAFLEELVAKNITINVDNLWELEQIIEIATCAKKQPTILLRVCGYSSPRYGVVPRVSRFGIPVAQIPLALLQIVKNMQSVILRGFSFHLDTKELKEKTLAIDNCLELFESAYQLRLAPTVLDIGGGFPQQFIDSKDNYETYLHALKQGIAGKGEALHWDGVQFGMRIEQNTVQVTPVFHKYGDTESGVDVLRQFLESHLLDHENRAVATVLQENMIELWLEPGKALVDHAGVTIAAVEFVKQAANGDTLWVTI